MSSGIDLEGFEVHAFYSVSLPSPFTAPVQILRTAAGLANLGAKVVVHVGSIHGPTEEILEAYDARADSLTLDPFFADGLSAWARLRWAQRRRALARELGRSSRRIVILTRGEETWPLLRPLLRRNGSCLHLHEVHRLGFVRNAERELGRRASPKDLCRPDIESLRRAESALVHAADGRAFVTEGVARDAHRNFGELGPSVVIPSGVAIDPGTSPSRPRYDIVYAGKLERRKGVYDLCSAMSRLPGRSLAIAGGDADSQRALTTHIAAVGVADRVHLVGRLRPTDVPRFLRQGRIGACPLPGGVDTVSDRYSSPMKLLEMMANGLATVVTDLPTIRAVVGEREAVIVPPNDAEAFAQAASTLLADPERASALGAAARRRAAEFSWARRAERFAGFIRALVR